MQDVSGQRPVWCPVANHHFLTWEHNLPRSNFRGNLAHSSKLHWAIFFDNWVQGILAHHCIELAVIPHLIHSLLVVNQEVLPHLFHIFAMFRWLLPPDVKWHRIGLPRAASKILYCCRIDLDKSQRKLQNHDEELQLTSWRPFPLSFRSNLVLSVSLCVGSGLPTDLYSPTTLLRMTVPACCSKHESYCDRRSVKRHDSATNSLTREKGFHSKFAQHCWGVPWTKPVCNWKGIFSFFLVQSLLGRHWPFSFSF